MSTQHTYAKNASAHPGAIVLAVQGKQWTKAEKQANDAHAATEKAAIERAEQEHVMTIAKMVMELWAKEQNATTPVSHTNLFILSIMTLMALQEVLGATRQASGIKGTNPSINDATLIKRAVEQGQ